jgi:hypothetical protein
MKSTTFLFVAAVIVALVLAMVYMHRPRSSHSTRTVAPHGNP